jgi:transcriptional regulator with XRE-family HTH domain
MVAIRKTKAKEEFGPDPYLDLPQDHLSHIEHDARTPSLELLYTLARALGAPPEEIVRGTDSPKVIALPDLRLLGKVSEEDLDHRLDTAGSADELWDIHRALREDENEIEAAMLRLEGTILRLQRLKSDAAVYRVATLSRATKVGDPSSKAPARSIAEIRRELEANGETPVSSSSSSNQEAG